MANNLIFLFLTVFNFAVKTPEKAPEGCMDADFFINIKETEIADLQHWTFEYQDGGKWKKAGKGLDVKKYEKGEVATLVQSFSVKKVRDSIRVRVECPENGGTAVLQQGPWGKPRIALYPGIKVKDSKRIALVGNSFTFYHASYFFLKQLARLHGHQLIMRCSLRGGQNLLQHTGLERTIALAQGGPYDIVIFQDQSQAAAELADGPTESAYVLDGAYGLAKAFRTNSPKARIIYECTWSYQGKANDFGGFGSMENFDRLLREGSRAVVEKTEGIDEMSPVGMAFEKARAAGFTLYSKDNKHQNRLGSYLKACVNYLFLYREPFDESLDLSCGIDCATAKTLREIASAVVGD